MVGDGASRLLQRRPGISLISDSFLFCPGDPELAGDVFPGGVSFVNITLIPTCSFILWGDSRSRKTTLSILYTLLSNHEGVESYHAIKISYRDMWLEHKLKSHMNEECLNILYFLQTYSTQPGGQAGKGGRKKWSYPYYCSCPGHCRYCSAWTLYYSPLLQTRYCPPGSLSQTNSLLKHWRRRQEYSYFSLAISFWPVHGCNIV